MGPASQFITRVKNRVVKSILQRKHSSAKLTLGHNNIYVLPSALGVNFCLVAILNFIMAINYQNNLILITSYLMFIVIFISFLLGFSNMKGMTITFIKVVPSFSPYPAKINISLSSENQSQAVYILYHAVQVTPQALSTIQQQAKQLAITLPYQQRGYYQLEPLKIVSNYPFGLVKVWSYIHIDTAVAVYPEPIAQLKTRNKIPTASQVRQGSDEFDQLINHQPTMGLQRISWRHFAKTQQLISKQFIEYDDTRAKFDYDKLTGSVEQRLSLLSYLVCTASEKNMPFSLKLGGQIFAENSGAIHKNQCLTLLSQYNENQ